MHGLTKWSQIAKLMHGRIGKQCRERWNNHLRPNIKVKLFLIRFFLDAEPLRDLNLDEWGLDFFEFLVLVLVFVLI